MIAKLSGIVDSTATDSAVIDVGGVGYMILCSGRTLAGLHVGEAVSVHVETHVREDHIHLYGFADAAEREWFRLLTQIQGVGAKVALAILSVLPPDGLVTAVAAGDKAALTQAAGVGPKLAGRLVSELKDKVANLAVAVAAMPVAALAAGSGPTADAVSALVNLGYGASEAMTAVAQCADRMGDGVGVEELIRAGLAELGPREHRA